MLVKVVDGKVDIFPYSINNLKKDNPNISFPLEINNNLLAEYSVFPVVTLDKPQCDLLTQYYSHGYPYLSIEGSWTVSWEVFNKPQAEAEKNVRDKRKSLIAETDYLALSDTTLTPEMTAYRQALRDITTQEGFPYNVVWPVKP